MDCTFEELIQIIDLNDDASFVAFASDDGKNLNLKRVVVVILYGLKKYSPEEVLKIILHMETYHHSELQTIISYMAEEFPAEFKLIARYVESYYISLLDSNIS